ncbi:MAG: GntR family transcriptional regulator [Collinsella sp.]
MSSEPYAIPPKDRAFEGILWYIKHYDLQGGDRLPAERVLCEELGVSRTALRAAITRLISCGTLESRRGSGTYVCPPKPLNIFQETWNYTQAVERVAQSRPHAWFGPRSCTPISIWLKSPDRPGHAALLHSARARG